MLRVLLAIAVASFVSCVQSAGKNLTVTEEAWFEVEVKNFEGKDHHYRGRFTVALFGDIAPLTVLNFISLVRGYRRQKVGGELLFISILDTCYNPQYEHSKYLV